MKTILGLLIIGFVASILCLIARKCAYKDGYNAGRRDTLYKCYMQIHIDEENAKISTHPQNEPPEEGWPCWTFHSGSR